MRDASSRLRSLPRRVLRRARFPRSVKLGMNPEGTTVKIFLDTANLDELKKGVSWGIVDGVTTNPTLIAKEGRPIDEHIREICGIVDGDVSAEVVSTVASK